ncbi:MFS transporter, partial [Pseudomonas sp. MWU13-2860]
MASDTVKTSVLRKTYLRILLPLFIASVLAFLDRVNVSYAALTMNADLGFDAKVYGLAAGIFFAGYVLFEVPGAILAERWSPSRWIARILFSWGAVSMLLGLVQNEWQFYVLRFLLGVCEASFYPVIYASVIPRWFVAETRARAI